MVQPRKEQIKNLKTRHALVYFSPTPGSAYTDIIDPAVDAQVISDTPGGAQEDVPAFVLSNISESAYAIFPGAAIDVSIDGGPVSTIPLAVGDKASTIADNVNTAIGTDVAFNFEGVLGIRSASLGAGTSVVLADNVGGSLLAIGLPAGTYTGADASTRGVVTTSPIVFASYAATAPGPIGAFVPIKDQRGKNITTDTSSIDSIEENLGFTIRRAYVPGGAPVHGRLSRNPADTEYRLAYYAQMPTEPEVVTFNSDFSLLDGTDAVTLTFNYKIKGPTGISPQTIIVPVTFPGPYPYDRDKVIDEINLAYAAVASGVGGNARVLGRIPQPFNFDAAAIMEVSIDGGAFVPVAFNPVLDKDAVTVSATINAAVGAPVAAPVTVGTNIYVEISSLTVDGRTSSVGIRNGVNDPLRTLGLQAGLYRGFFVAEPYGSEEIRLRGVARGSDASFTVGLLGPFTAARLGISAGTYNGADLGEVKINFPDIDFVDPTETHAAKALFPEVLEYGEVDPAVESIVEQFNVKVLDSQWGNGADLITDGSGIAAASAPYRGVKDAGKPVYVSPFGTIDPGLARDATARLEAILGKFVVGNLAPYVEQVDRLAAPVFETPSGPNPSAASSTMTFDLDPDGDFAPGSREYYFQIERDAASTTPWRLGENTPITGMSYEVRLSGYNVLRSNNYPLALSDPNVWASGLISGGLEYLNLSDSNHQYTKRLEYNTNADPTPHSLLSKANSIWTCTVGDGIDSFGDFNGSYAIHDAIDYFTANIVPLSSHVSYGLHIQCKPGLYLVNAIRGPITVPASCDFTIEGTTGLKYQSWRQVEIVSYQPEAINFTPGGISTLRLLNLTVRYASSSAFTDIVTTDNNHYIEAEDCEFRNTRLRLLNTHSCIIKKCEFQQNAFTATGENILIEMGDGGQHSSFRFVDCQFYSSRDNPVIRVKASGATITRTTIPSIEFHRCRMFLSTTSDNAGNLLGNSGIIDTDPNGSSWFNPGEGLEIEKLLFKDCKVEMSAASFGAQTLIHLIPTSNGASILALTDEFVMYWDVEISGGSWISSDDDSAYSPFVIAGVWNLTIRDTVLGFWLDSTPLYGGPTADLDYWFTGVFGGALPATNQWGAFATYAWQNTIWNNVRFQNLVQRSDCGDLFIRYNQLSMSNIFMNQYAAGGTGAATGPYQRIRFRPHAEDTESVGQVSNMVIGPAADVNASSGTDWAQFAIIMYEPSLANFVFDGVKIRDFDISGGAFTNARGIWLPSAAVGDYYTGSPNVTDNLTITNCIFRRLNVGISYDSNETDQELHCIITDNQMYGCEYYGIVIGQYGSGGYFDVLISNNKCQYNALGEGVRVLAEHWLSGGTSKCTAIVTNNICSANQCGDPPGAGPYTGDQIYFGCRQSATYTNQQPRGIVTGNSTSYNVGAGSNLGAIRVNFTSGVTPTALIPMTTPNSYGNFVRGAETDISVVGTPTQFTFQNGSGMMHNHAYLNSS